MSRPIGPSEFDQLRNQWKVGPSNFDQYFVRDSKGGISVKDEVDPRRGDSSSLKNTLPSEQKQNELPTGDMSGQVDEMTALQIMLRESTNLALKGGMKSGSEALLGGMAELGYTPEKMSGNFTANIIDFVEGQTVDKVTNQYELMAQIVDGISKKREQEKQDALNTRNEARDQISQMIGSGMWNKLEDGQRSALWQAAGYTGNPTTMQKTSFYHTEDADGNVWNIVYDSETGEVIKKENLGPIGTPSSTGSQGQADNLAEKQAKLIKDFKDELMDPKKVGIDRRIATKGEEQTDNQTYVSREEFINKLIAKWGDQIEPEDIRRSVYEAYPDRQQAEI